MFPFQLNRHTAGRSAEGAATSKMFSFLLNSVESFDVSCSKWCLGALSQKYIQHLEKVAPTVGK